MEILKHKVQYYETDQMGCVHHSNYIRWFEEARTFYMEQFGLGYKEAEDRGIISPVMEVNARYVSMAKYSDVVTIEIYVKELKSLLVTFGYEVRDSVTNEVRCKGSSKHCFLDREGKPISLKKDQPEYYEMFQGWQK